MKKFLPLVLLFVLLSISASHAQTPEIDLFDWGFNIDGTTHCLGGPCDFDVINTGNITGPEDLPSSIDISNFDFATGLGSIDITFSTPGDHTFIALLDLDIDFDINVDENETGAAANLPVAPGQTWEIDEPGFGSLQNGSAGVPYIGNIFDNFLKSDSDEVNGSALDNQAFFDANVPQTLTPPDAVSMAMGWDFVLAAGETATVTVMVSETEPPGFHLVQSDPDSAADVYMSGFIDIVVSLECQSGETRACNTGLLGVCADGTETCDANGSWSTCVQDVQSSSEVCDGNDNDCDGDTDESCPSIPQLVFPADGQSDLNTSVEFIWKKSTDPDGDIVSYELNVCEDIDFSAGCITRANIASVHNKGIHYAGTGMGLSLFGLVFAFGIKERRKSAFLLIVIMSIALLSVSCGGGGGGDGGENPDDEVSQTISGLNKATTYYWKVVADDGNGNRVESEGRSFTTLP